MDLDWRHPTDYQYTESSSLTTFLAVTAARGTRPDHGRKFQTLYATTVDGPMSAPALKPLLISLTGHPIEKLTVSTNIPMHVIRAGAQALRIFRIVLISVKDGAVLGVGGDTMFVQLAGNVP